MFRAIQKQLFTAVSGIAAKQLVADISRHHRIQASPDFDSRPWVRSASYFAANEWTAVQDWLESDTENTNPERATGAPNNDERVSRVPQRMFPRPIWEQSLLRYPPELAERLYQLQTTNQALPRILPTLALYWAGGQRGLAQIANLIELETDIWAPEYIVGYFEILAELEVIRW